MFNLKQKRLAQKPPKLTIKPYFLQPQVSNTMREQIKMWFTRFCSEEDSLHLMAVVSAHIAHLTNAELQVAVQGGERAQYLQAILQRQVLPRMHEAVQLMCIGGQVVLKPVVQNKQVGIELVSAERFFPLAYDVTGMVTDAFFTDTRETNGICYTRLERHTLQNNEYVVTNEAFVNSGGVLGARVNLSVVDDWGQLQEETVMQGILRPLFGCFRMPGVNHIDPASPLPVSLFARCMDTLDGIDKLYEDYLWEFKSGKRKKIVDELCVRRDLKTGKIMLEDADEYIKLNLQGQEQMFTDYTPHIRQEEYQNGLNQLLRLLEMQVGVSSGTFSFDTARRALTATQVISEDRTTYYTITDIQRAAGAAIEELLQALDALATLYHLAPVGEYKASIQFGDSVFEDTQSEFDRLKAMVEMGMRPQKLLAWYFNVDEETAKGYLTDLHTDDTNAGHPSQGQPV